MLNVETGSIVENLSGREMFTSNEIDERGEVPAPFNVEKYNFNPHNLMGDFDFNENKPSLMKN